MSNYLLTGARILDGSRAPAFFADVGIRDGRMVLHPQPEQFADARRIDLKGLCLAPGFIDIHTHSDACALAEGAQASAPMQGVTLNMAANCGISLFPLHRDRYQEALSFYHRVVEIAPGPQHGPMYSMSDYAAAMAGASKRIHYGTLVGHGTLRAHVIGFAQREASTQELDSMCALLDRQLKEGAFGMSLGLIYPPSSYGNLDEFIALSRVLKANRAILTVHMRSESTKLFEAVGEMLEVARQSGVHLHLSHLKLIGRAQWGRAAELLQLIESAREQGATVTCDQYPYEASSTGLTALVPGWAQDGGTEKMLERLKTGDQRLLGDIRAEMERRGGAHCVEIAATYGHLPHYEGRKLDDIAAHMELSPQQTAAQLLIACGGAVACIYFSMDMGDIHLIMQDMRIAVGSDGYNFCYDLSYKPHPRSFGSFPRFLREVREQRLMPLQDAVYKMTGLPADILGLQQRGRIRDGYWADLCVFDPQQVAEGATFQQPATPPQGIPYVFVNGQLAVDQGQLTDCFAGEMLLKP